MSKITEQIAKIRPDFQDEFFISLNKILLPVGGFPFEKTALDVALYIAHEYGARIDILHIGKSTNQLIDDYIEKIKKYNISYELVVVQYKTVARAIIAHWKKHKHKLVIMAARRKPTIIDKLVISSVSNQVIKNVDAEVLQVFPPKLNKLSNKLKKITVLLPYSNRDPFLIRWASAIAAPQKNAKINIIHVCSIPEIVPLEEAKNEKEIINEEREFKQYVEQYSAIFGHFLTSKVILGHDVFAAFEYMSEKDEPDVVIIGSTKISPIKGFFLRPLSCKIRDKLLNPSVIIHHSR